MRHYVAVAAIALLLTGCSTASEGGDGGAGQPGSTTPAGGESGTSGESGTDGLVSLELGDTAELSANTDGTEPATWTIEKIEIDPASCGGPRDSGHLLLLHVRADSGPDANAAEQIPTVFRAESFTEPGENGGSSPASPWVCQSSEPGGQPLPVPYQLNQELIGTVGLVVPEANGTLIQAHPVTTGEAGSGRTRRTDDTTNPLPRVAAERAHVSCRGWHASRPCSPASQQKAGCRTENQQGARAEQRRGPREPARRRGQFRGANQGFDARGGAVGLAPQVVQVAVRGGRERHAAGEPVRSAGVPGAVSITPSGVIRRSGAP